jgi:hypothetical protein
MCRAWGLLLNSCCYAGTRGSPSAGYIQQSHWSCYAACIYVHMPHSRICEIAVAMSRMMPSVVTFLLSAVLLVLCEYGNGLKFFIIHKSELLQYCIEVVFIVTSKLEGLFCYFWLILGFLTKLTVTWYRYDIFVKSIWFNSILFTPSGSSTIHIYTQTIHRTTQ